MNPIHMKTNAFTGHNGNPATTPKLPNHPSINPSTHKHMATDGGNIGRSFKTRSSINHLRFARIVVQYHLLENCPVVNFKSWGLGEVHVISFGNLVIKKTLFFIKYYSMRKENIWKRDVATKGWLGSLCLGLKSLFPPKILGLILFTMIFWNHLTPRVCACKDGRRDCRDSPRYGAPCITTHTQKKPS